MKKVFIWILCIHIEWFLIIMITDDILNKCYNRYYLWWWNISFCWLASQPYIPSILSSTRISAVPISNYLLIIQAGINTMSKPKAKYPNNSSSISKPSLTTISPSKYMIQPSLPFSYLKEESFHKILRKLFPFHWPSPAIKLTTLRIILVFVSLGKQTMQLSLTLQL